MNYEDYNTDDDVLFDDVSDLNQLDFGGKSEDDVEEDIEYVEENLWAKLEKGGKKISFARDIVEKQIYKGGENMIFGYHNEPAYNKNTVMMDNAAIRGETEAKMERFDVRPPNPKLQAKNFSGGNQQKIVLAREIERNPDLLLVGQPTRGVDIGAIEFIHQRIVELRDQGKAILLVSVELEEILSLSDRIIVMFDGHIMGERDPAQTDEKELGMLMAGMETNGGVT